MSAKLQPHELADLGRLLLDTEQTHFSALLVRLIKKADHENRFLLRKVFPQHVSAVAIWEHTGGKPMWTCANCDGINPDNGGDDERCRGCGKIR